MKIQYITIILGLVSLTSQASDLIYKQGFENTRLVAGQVSGLAATGLELQLTADVNDTLVITENGGFIFELDVTVGQAWSVAVHQLPNNPQQQSCQLSQNAGVMADNGVNNVLIVCDNKAWNWNEMNWDEGGWN